MLVAQLFPTKKSRDDSLQAWRPAPRLQSGLGDVQATHDREQRLGAPESTAW
jgi:hypothetical protein